MNKLTVTQFENFSKLVEEYSGIRVEENRLDDLSVSILVRAKELNITLDKYFTLLKSGAAEDELKKVVGCLTVNETSFMRYPEQFELLEKAVIPILTSAAGPRPLNVWSVGCSSGEEPYSIAITLNEILPSKMFNIVATDIDKRALDRAKKAVYQKRSVRLLSNAQLRRYFRPLESGAFELIKEIREMINFQQHNIASLTPPFGFSLFDMIFCRNVLIYFNKEKFRKIINFYHHSLSGKGYLFLGHSESLYAIFDGFKARELNNAYVYQKMTLQPKPQEQSKKSINKDKEKGIDKPKLTKNELPERPAFENALNFYTKKDPDNAFKEIQKIKKLDFEVLLLKAQILLELGRLNETKGICMTMLKNNSLSGYPYFVLGLIALKENKEKEALDHFRKASYSLKKFALPHFFLANIYRRNRDDKRAFNEYAKCGKLLEQSSSDNIWKILSPHFTPAAIAKTCKQALAKTIA